MLALDSADIDTFKRNLSAQEFRFFSPTVSMDLALLLDNVEQYDRRMSIPSCSENNLKFICEFQPGPGPPQASGDKDYNVNMDCKSVSVILPAQCSVHQLRLRICMQVGKPLLDGVMFKSFQIYFLFCSLSEGFMCPFQYMGPTCKNI